MDDLQEEITQIYKDYELMEDIYQLTFLMMISSDDIIVHYELILKSTAAFFFQIALISFLVHENAGLSNFFLGSPEVNCVRLICTLLLHL